MTPTIMSTGARLAMILFTLGFVLNLIETAYFGWHWSAGVTSVAEAKWDFITTVMIIIGLIMGIYYRHFGG